MRKILTNKILLGVLCIAIGMAPLLTLVNVAGSGKAMLAKEFNKRGKGLISLKFNGAAVTYSDLKNLKEQMPEMKTMLPISKMNTKISSYKSNVVVELKAVGDSYWKVAGLDIIKGKFISRGQVDSVQNVVVLDDLTADKLFGTTEVLGRTVDISLGGTETEASIIGVCKKNDISGEVSDSELGMAFIPISMLDYNMDGYSIDEVLFAVDLHFEEAKARLVHYFTGIGAGEDQLEINYITQISLIKNFMDQNMQPFIAAGLLWLLAAIVGLINIMLLDVEKHRRYYGLLKFYGSTEKQIKRIVLANALTIGLASSIFSIAAALTASFIICLVLNIPIFVSVHTLTIGILIPGILCLAAAIYPAMKACRIDMNKVVWQFD